MDFRATPEQDSIRDAVRALCARYPDEYWRDLDRRSAYPEDIARPWSKILAELAKCVMLCANCHREVHAGVRELDQGVLGLAEDALRYVA